MQYEKFGKFFLTFGICVFSVATFFVIPAFGHGIGGETLQPVTVGNKNATIFLSIEPPVFDQTEKEQRVLVHFLDPDTEQVFENVTYIIEVSKGGERIFRYMFFDEIGFLILKIIPTNSEEITVHAAKEPVLGGWMKDGNSPITIEGPIFNSGGLYNFDIEILTVDSVTNVLDERVTFNGAISVAEKTLHDITGSDGKSYQLGITSYYDQIKNFEYNSEDRSIKFSMPFSWDQQSIEQTEIVHEEIHIPKTFGDLLVPKYYAEVNGIPLPENSVLADDYSEEDRIVHVIMPQAVLYSIKEAASEISETELEFYAKPSQDLGLPLSAKTTNLMYTVDLWWDPPVIKSNQEAKFYVDFTESFVVTKNPKPVTFDFILAKDNKEIFRQKVNAEANVEPKSNFVDYQFSDKELGPVKVIVESINDDKFSSTDFMVVVEPQEVQMPKFPLRLSSMTLNENGQEEGSFYVDVTWFSSPLRIDEESEFIITIYDKSTEIPVPQAEYDFVLLQNGNEIHRTSGVARAGGNFENFEFSENQLGDVVLRIENIDQTEEFVEIPITVTPEFPLGGLIILPIVILAAIIFSSKYAKVLYE